MISSPPCLRETYFVSLSSGDDVGVLFPVASKLISRIIDNINRENILKGNPNFPLNCVCHCKAVTLNDNAIFVFY